MTKPEVERYLLTVDSDGYPEQMLRHMASDVAFVNKENGWYEDGRTFGDDMALIHSEVSEALEAFREWGLEDKTGPRILYRRGDNGEDLETPPPHKPEGVGSEFADVLIRLLDCARRYGINLSEEFQRKMRYNRTRGYRHGGKRL